MFLWRRRAIRSALERHAPDLLAGVVAGLATGDLAAAYPALPSRSIDYAVMEAARCGRRGRDGRARRRLERHRHVAGPARGARRGRATARWWRPANGARGGAGRPRWWSAAPTGSACAAADGTISVQEPIAHLRGAADAPAARAGAPRPVCSSGGASVTSHGPRVAAHPDRLRHRRLAGTGRGRLHVRERAPLRGRRRPLRRRARRAGEGRRRRLRPPVRLGALRGGRGRGPARPRHPGRVRPHAPCRRRCARTRSSSAARRRASSSPPATTRGPTTASRSSRRRAPRPAPDDPRGRRGRRSRRNGGPRSSAGPFADAEAAGLVECVRPVSRATSGSSAGRSTSTR